MAKIAVCVGIRNRSKQLVDCLLLSLKRCAARKSIALSVYDCHSDDVPNLEVAIRKEWRGVLHYQNSPNQFTRSSAFNGAVRQCEEEYLFLCDADMTLPPDFVSQFTNNVNKNQIWFPICFNLKVNRPMIIHKSNGKWRGRGFGILGIHRNKFEDTGSLPESFTSWGGEDTFFYTQCRGVIIRERCKGLFHNWHDDSLDFKNQWYNT